MLIASTRTPLDDLATQELLALMHDKFYIFESPEEAAKRAAALEALDETIQAWAKDVTAPEAADSAGCKLFTFGSCRLGVQGPGADIDALVVAPRSVDREKHFFGTLVNVLL